ncbi:Acetyltransferase (GNAT) domain-containing protein [Alkalibacterium subtropicum]|uniref:Acetyltransferase (GNAT) domain-containing protein n=1 Tax=Alkalibacterium subtropicum TaxID=753702 RepID=A0A1I1K7Q7_9LACT|nr:GNAT family N-acetyltransferase [Alkalibacterium subtropicum]SFC56844.1 Acetyltransferase (GNAT) domain-containing protein [Alkalibacterium subtropicum]
MNEISDVDTMYQLLIKFDTVFSPSLSEKARGLKDYAEKLVNNAVTYAAIKDCEVVGFISFYLGDEKQAYAYITLLAVVPEYQGRKNAQALFDRCIEKIREVKINTVELEVEKNNVSAISFYKKNDFKIIEETSDNNFYMQKQL